jgi:uncharacterized protein YacL
MNTTRLIWVTTTILFTLVGLLLGRWLGGQYIHSFEGLDRNSYMLAGKPLGTLIVVVMSVGLAIVLARLGSWIANRFIIAGLRHFQTLSAADRVLSIIGGLLGLLFGVLATLPLLALPDKALWLPVQLCVMAVTSALGMALLQGMRAEMVRVLPQLEAETKFQPHPLGSRPKLIDTNIIIDGRMADLCRTGFIEGPIYVPNFVLNEVQYIADSSDSMRRARGRRGLEVLNDMHEIHVLPNGNSTEEVPLVHVLNEIPHAVQKIDTVDAKLVGLAKEMGAVIVTNDYNLNRVAELQGVKVLNINELTQALKPVVLPGEEMMLQIVKEGKEPGQGVGYLDDGTMVVVGDGQRHIGETCKVAISSVYQTVAGKMIFADIKGQKGAGDDLFNDSYSSPAKHNDDFGNRSGGGLRRKSKS